MLKCDDVDFNFTLNYYIHFVTVLGSKQETVRTQIHIQQIPKPAAKIIMYNSTLLFTPVMMEASF